MRVSNIDYPQAPRRATLGQYGPYQTTYTTRREAAFKLIDEEGYHNVNSGKKFPYQISNVVAADGTPLMSGAPILGTAVSGEDSVVRIPIDVPQGAGQPSLGDQPVDATLSLWKVYNNIQYPIFQNRRLRFTVPPASPLPLDLQPIYASYEADKYAEETARLDQIMAEQYAAMIKSEQEAKESAAKAAAAAQDAAAKKQAAQDAVDAAVNAESVRNKKLLFTIGGLAALGAIAYFALAKSD